MIFQRNRLPIAIVISVVLLQLDVLHAALIGVDFNLTGPAPTNWSRLTATNPSPTTSTPLSLTNLIAENGATTNIDFSLSSSVGFIRGFDNTLAATTIPSHSNSLTNLGGYFHNDTSADDTATAIFRELDLASTYRVWVFVTRVSSVIDTYATITGSGAPITFRSLGTGPELFINGQLGSSSQTLDSYALQVLPNNSGEIIISWTEGPTASRYTVAGLAIEQVPEPASGYLVLSLSCSVSWPRRKYFRTSAFP